MKKFVYLFLLIVAFACSNRGTDKDIPKKAEINKYTSIEDTLYLPFDTNKVIEMLDIEYMKGVEEMEKGLDTICVMYFHSACDCPDWIDTSKQNMDFPEKYKYCYYIEPKSKEVELDERICVHSNHVVLIGKLRTKEGWLRNAKFIDPNPPKGNVFEYSAYKVVLPITVYGPLYHTGTTELPQDTEELIQSSHITIKNLY